VAPQAGLTAHGVSVMASDLNYQPRKNMDELQKQEPSSFEKLMEKTGEGLIRFVENMGEMQKQEAVNNGKRLEIELLNAKNRNTLKKYALGVVGVTVIVIGCLVWLFIDRNMLNEGYGILKDSLLFLTLVTTGAFGYNNLK